MAMSQGTAIDISAITALQALAGEGEETTLLKEVVSAFFNSSPPLLNAMKESSQRNDPKSLRDAAHSLKSSSALVGARRLSETCQAIEQCNAIDADSKALVARAQSIYDAAVEELREIVDQTNSGVV